MWHLLSRITLHGKDEALRLKTDKMETIPIAIPSESTRVAIQQITPRLRELASRRIEANALIAGWLQHSLALKPEAWRSTDFTMFDADAFIAAVINDLPKNESSPQPRLLSSSVSTPSLLNQHVRRELKFSR